MPAAIERWASIVEASAIRSVERNERRYAATRLDGARSGYPRVKFIARRTVPAGWGHGWGWSSSCIIISLKKKLFMRLKGQSPQQPFAVACEAARFGVLASRRTTSARSSCAAPAKGSKGRRIRPAPMAPNGRSRIPAATPVPGRTTPGSPYRRGDAGAAACPQSRSLRGWSYARRRA